MSGYTWGPIYEELATKLMAYEERQEDLVAILRGIKAKGRKLISLVDDDGVAKVPLKILDPFSFFASFNRGTTHANRQQILADLREQLGLQAPVPTDVDERPAPRDEGPPKPRRDHRVGRSARLHERLRRLAQGIPRQVRACRSIGMEDLAVGREHRLGTVERRSRLERHAAAEARGRREVDRDSLHRSRAASSGAGTGTGLGAATAQPRPEASMPLTPITSGKPCANYESTSLEVRRRDSALPHGSDRWVWRLNETGVVAAHAAKARAAPSSGTPAKVSMSVSNRPGSEASTR